MLGFDDDAAAVQRMIDREIDRRVADLLPREPGEIARGFDQVTRRTEQALDERNNGAFE